MRRRSRNCSAKGRLKPKIGITVNAKQEPLDKSGGKLWLNWNYAQAIADFGGVPLLIPPQANPEDLVGVLDGWLIPGGEDIDARHFGEANHPSVSPIEEERFQMEDRLFKMLPRSFPVLGICYGCQFINVQRGGKLVQHLPDVLGGDDHATGVAQDYRVQPGSKLHAILGQASAHGKSYHHQAVGKLGEGLEVVATHADGTVEALEATDRPWVIGVQWHPERTAQSRESQNLFKSFIAAAAEYAQERAGGKP